MQNMLPKTMDTVHTPLKYGYDPEFRQASFPHHNQSVAMNILRTDARCRLYLIEQVLVSSKAPMRSMSKVEKVKNQKSR